MLFVLSPAKSLDESLLSRDIKSSKPAFMGRAAELVSVMRKHSPQQIASLMKLSDKLALLNAARYEAWSQKNTAKNSKPAVLMFNGDVYDGLDAKSLDDASLTMPKTIFNGNVTPNDKPKYSVGCASGMAKRNTAGTAM